MITELVGALVVSIVAVIAAVAALITGRKRTTGGVDAISTPAGCAGPVECAPGLTDLYGDCFTPDEAAAARAVVDGNDRDRFPGLALGEARLAYRAGAFHATCRRPCLDLPLRSAALRLADWVAAVCRALPDTHDIVVRVAYFEPHMTLPAAAWFPDMRFHVAIDDRIAAVDAASAVASFTHDSPNVEAAVVARGGKPPCRAAFAYAGFHMYGGGARAVADRDAMFAAGRAEIIAEVDAWRPVAFAVVAAVTFAESAAGARPEFLAGDFRMYPWGPCSGGGVLLCQLGPDESAARRAPLDAAALEQRVFRRNLAERTFGWYPADVPAASRGGLGGLCCCFDCAAEVAVWRAVFVAGGRTPGAPPGSADAAPGTAAAELTRRLVAGGHRGALSTLPHGFRPGDPMVVKRAAVIDLMRALNSAPANDCRAAGLVEFATHCLTADERAAAAREAVARTPAPELTLGPDSPRLPYRRYNVVESATIRTPLHVGQRKLLMEEVDFLTAHAVGARVVVYAGAAPGTHIPYLGTLFPWLEWELFDPREFAPGTRHAPRVRTHVQFFEDVDAKKFAGRPGVLFVSDIRTGEAVHTLDTATANALVADDMAMQRRWVELMRPAAFSLKFRLPYSVNGGRLAPVEYLAGEVRVQPWAPLSSTETRLVGGAGDWARSALYNPMQYESANYFLNTITRQWRTFPHGVPTASVPGLDLCFDCAAEVLLWRRYEAARGRPDSGPAADAAVAAHMRNVSTLIRRGLREAYHGMFPDMPLVDKMPWIAVAQKKGARFLGPEWRPAASGQARTRAQLARMTPRARSDELARKKQAYKK